MSKKKFSPIMINKLSKPMVSIGKHIDSRFEYIATPESHWYDQYDCADLTQKFGSPLFVVSEKEIHAKLRQFRKFFQFPGFETVIAYSFKTNYLPGVCDIFLKEKCWAEVVSGMEYQLARKLKVKGSYIIFNGPYKTDEELTEAVHHDSLIHLDHWDELHQLEKIVKKLKKKARVGIRFNFPYYHFHWDKFGFLYDEINIKTLLTAIRDNSLLEFVSIHNHCGTYIIEPDVYAASVNIMEKICEIALALKLKPKIIDIGGGFPSKAKLRQQFTGNNLAQSPELSAYADAIWDGLARIRKRVGEDLLLVCELGRAVIDEAVILICTVIANKKGMHENHITLVDAGVNILPTTYWYHREPKVLSDTNQNYIKRRICGPLCMQIDVLNEAAYLADTPVGTRMIIPNVGAYNQTQSMQFIQYRPATVLLKENNKTQLIRRKENFNDIFIADFFPK